MPEPPPIVTRGAWWRCPATEDLEAILGSIRDGVLVLDEHRRKILAINHRLASWLPSEVRSRILESSPLDWIEPGSRGPFLALGDTELRRRPVRIRVHGTEGPFDVDARGDYCVNQQGEGRWVYWLRPVAGDPSVLEKLEGEIIAQKQRAADAVRTAMQIYQVTEKVRAAPRLSTLLIGVREEEELFTRVGEFLLSEAIHCRFVRILMCDAHGRLRCVWSSAYARDRREAPPEGLTLPEAFAELMRGDLGGSSRWETLDCRGEKIGILELQLDPREEQLLDDAPLFRQWLDEGIRTVAEMLALFHENIRLYRQLESQALYDPLTGLFNRHHLFNQLEREVQRAHREKNELALIFIDLDGFKEINDGYGHLVGDRILTEVARLLVDSFRETDYLCRFGGDEFVVILPTTEASAAMRKAGSLIEEIGVHRFNLEERTAQIPLTLSIGVAGLEPGEDAREVIRRADEALYLAKRSGRNRALLAPSVESESVE